MKSAGGRKVRQPARTIRIISGVFVKGNNQEAFAGDNLPNPISLTVYGKDGKPVAGVPVYFKLASSPEKKITAKFKKSAVNTNESGVAETTFKMGTTTGTYILTAEVADPDRGIVLMLALSSLRLLLIWKRSAIILRISQNVLHTYRSTTWKLGGKSQIT